MNEHLQAESLTTRATTRQNNAKPGGALTFQCSNLNPMYENYCLLCQSITALQNTPTTFKGLPYIRHLLEDHKSPSVQPGLKQCSVSLHGKTSRRRGAATISLMLPTYSLQEWCKCLTLFHGDGAKLAAPQMCCQYILLPSFNPRGASWVFKRASSSHVRKTNKQKKSECHSVWLLQIIYVKHL